MLDPQAVTTWRRQIVEINQELKSRATSEADDEEFAAAMRELSLQDEG